ncbi:MAG: hypothetical protein WED34_21235 [Planctomycetales bacterium]
MPLQFTTPERIVLKNHPDFTEKWVQERIADDPSMLGLGDVDLLMTEKPQHKAGRLDILLHDDQLERRYEVELMLGKTDPSHIMRCIEYWDIERRRYPAYDHVAVLVAEDITSRFLNLMALLAGSVPLIAVQLVALRVDDKIALHFVHVLDQTSLRTDDEYEGRPIGPSPPVQTDRKYWEARVPPEVLNLCDSVCAMASELSGDEHALSYRRRLIDVIPVGTGEGRIWLVPKKTLVRVGGYVPEPEEWVKSFDDAGQAASLRRGNKAALVSFKPSEFDPQRPLLQDFFQAVLGTTENDGE